MNCLSFIASFEQNNYESIELSIYGIGFLVLMTVHTTIFIIWLTGKLRNTSNTLEGLSESLKKIENSICELKTTIDNKSKEQKTLTDALNIHYDLFNNKSKDFSSTLNQLIKIVNNRDIHEDFIKKLQEFLEQFSS